MTDYTFNTRLNQLIQQVKNHPYQEEVLKLAQEQLIEDTDVVESLVVTFN
jgi:hypothetical protein